MAPGYADHPFPLIQTPVFAAKQDANAKPDSFDRAASEMANAHNLMIRGLNSIYLQAPHIAAPDVKPFCRYIAAFTNLIHVHHHGEETQFFPEVKKLSGVEGIMETNVHQHGVFKKGLHELDDYVTAVLADKQEYDGKKVVGMIDAFGGSLVEHLRDEIPTLQRLRELDGEDEKMAGLIEKIMNEEGESSMKALGMPGMLWYFANLDIHYENDMWLDWPAAPGPVKFLSRNVFWWVYTDLRKFGSVDRNGKLKGLYAVPESG
ncbi:hypothetical protein B0T21DRAFT_377584 [Apiosordaria backusii]|uniref:Hemerythrin-like domain-containing protein n=1 Tax=Apiosordaria backusii TaxID=314023 RepID=A0AA40DLL9_9PEZI|nr:hypothetical protein B0T21DRAFT_377584 [Apiosordaria backusii]